jgi:hypothetical protein
MVSGHLRVGAMKGCRALGGRRTEPLSRAWLPVADGTTHFEGHLPRYVVAFITNYATAANATAPLASAVGCDEGVAIVLERRGQQKSEDNESRPLGEQWLAAPSSRSTFRT